MPLDMGDPRTRAPLGFVRLTATKTAVSRGWFGSNVRDFIVSGPQYATAIA